MQSQQPIGVGLIGYGFVGKTFHAPLIGAVDGLDLRGVVSGDAPKVHADLPGVTVYPTSAKMPATALTVQRSGVDVVRARIGDPGPIARTPADPMTAPPQAVRTSL